MFKTQGLINRIGLSKMRERSANRPHLLCVGYHAVRPRERPRPSYSKNIIQKNVFERDIKLLIERGYTFVSLDELISKLGKKVDKNYAFIYFDDGYKDVLDFTLPVLEKNDIRSTVFITTDFISDIKNPWKEKNTFLSWDEINNLKGKFDFGSHGVSHRKLAKLSDMEVDEELLQSKNIIEERIGREVRALSYPHSSFDRKVQNIAIKIGYKVTVGNGRGKNYRFNNHLKKTLSGVF